MNTGELAHVIDTLIGLRGMVLSGRGFSMPSMVEGIDEAIAALKDGHTAESATHEILASMCQLLEELLAEMKRWNSVAREGAVSSVEIKFLAPTKDHPDGKPQPVVKTYAGSIPPVEEAIEAYGRAFLMAQQASIEGWEQTLDVLAAEKRATAMFDVLPNAVTM